MPISPAILRNLGAPVDVAKVALGLAGDWEPLRNEEGVPETEERYIRFTNNNLADIEDAFGTQALWQSELEIKPQSAMRKTLSVLWGVEARRVGAMLLPEYTDRYSVAMGVAFALAQGVDPMVAVTIYQRGNQALDEVVAARDKAAESLNDEIETALKEVQTNASPSTAGSEAGSEPSETPPDSGS